MKDLKQKRYLIGGDFEMNFETFMSSSSSLDITRGRLGTWTLSGRSALFLILKKLNEAGVVHVHLPSYLCESILSVIKSMGLKYDFYPVDMNLEVHPDPPRGSAVLLIHYFGKLNSATKSLREEAGNDFYLIEDASQALLSDWSKDFNKSQYVILSPRKFGPVIFGGWCNVLSQIDEVNEKVEKVAWQSLAARLIKAQYLGNESAKIEQQTENFYLESFNDVERFIDENPTCTYLPDWVKRLVAECDWIGASAKRRENFHLLREMLSQDIDMLFSDINPEEVPLGFVVRLKKRDWIRMKMAEERIFCPIHWRLPNDISKAKFPHSHELSDSLLTIPIDQRYDSEDMELVTTSLKKLLKSEN